MRMRIAKIEGFRIELPLRFPHRWRGLNQEIGSYLLVRVTDVDGCVGWGEASALLSWGGEGLRYSAESPESIWMLLAESFGPRTIGVQFGSRSALLHDAWKYVKGYPYARSITECALLDLEGRKMGIPVHALLGGAVREKIAVAQSIGLMDYAEAKDRIAGVLDEGCRYVKLKIGEDAARDLEFVPACVELINGRANVSLDANQGYGTASAAYEVLRQFEGLPVQYVEQPTESLFEMAKLATKTSIPLMADESVWTRGDLRDLIYHGGVDLVSIYVGKGGGPTEGARMDAVAETFGIGTNVNGSGESGLGNMSNLHLAAVLRTIVTGSTIPVSQRADSRATEFVGARYADDILTESCSYDNGYIDVPDGPGWGVDVDEEKVLEFAAWHRIVS